MNAHVVSIHRVPLKHGPAEALQCVPVRANYGLEGDSRSRANRGRQITLIEADALAFVAKALNLPAVPPGASRRQLVVCGIALNDTVGKRLRVGPLLLDVDELCDPCKNMETAIGRGAWRAMENRGGIVARVLEGGVLSLGDPVSLADA